MHLFKTFHFICKCCSFVVTFKHVHRAITLMNVKFRMNLTSMQPCTVAMDVMMVGWCVFGGA